MAGDLRTSVVVDLAGNLARRAPRFGQAMRTFGATSRRELSLVRGAAAAGGRALDRFGNRYTALAGGVVGVSAARDVISLERRFTRLGQAANKTEAELDALKKAVFDTALAPEIRVNPDQILDAISEIVEKTGDLDFARENLENIGLAIQASGAAGRDVGGMLAEFQKMDLKNPREVLETFDTMNLQGKAGAFTIQNIARLGPRVVTAYTAMGRSGKQAMREMGAALQVIRQGTGSSEMAATAWEAFLATLADPKKLKMLQGGGIQVFDPEELAKGNQVLRPANELMAEIIKRADGKGTVLARVFDREAIRAFNAALGEFKRTGAIESLETFMNVMGDGTQTVRDASRAAADAAGAIEMLHTSWRKFTNESLDGPIQRMAGALDALGSERTGTALEILTYIGAGGFAGRQAYKAGRRVLDFGRKAAERLGERRAARRAARGLSAANAIFARRAAATGGKAVATATRGGILARGAKVLGTAARFVLPRAAMATPVGLAVTAGAAGLAGIGYLLKKYIDKKKEREATPRVADSRWEGVLRVRIDADGRTQVAELRSAPGGPELDVDTGLVMVTP